MKSINKPKLYFGNYIERSNMKTKIYDCFSLFVLLTNGQIYDVANEKIITKINIDDIFNIKKSCFSVTNLLPVSSFFSSDEIVKNNYDACLKVLNYNLDCLEDWINVEDLIYKNSKFCIKDEKIGEYKFALMDAKTNYFKSKSDDFEIADTNFQLNDDIYIARSITREIEVFQSLDSWDYDKVYHLIRRLNYILGTGYVFLNKINDNFYDINTGSLIKKVSYEELVTLKNSENKILESINCETRTKELIGYFGIMRVSDFILKYNIPIDNLETIFDNINELGTDIRYFSVYQKEEELMAPKKDYMSKSISLILTK